MESSARPPASDSPHPLPADPALPTLGQGSSFQDLVSALTLDPQIRRLAERYARSRDVAYDALQETYYAVVRVRDPEHITDLRKYFCRVLQRQVVELLEVAGPSPADDMDALIAARSDGVPRPGGQAEERAVRSVQAAAWLRRLARLPAVSVPGRSADTRRYQSVVVDIARCVLSALLEGEVSGADMDRLLAHAYPEWFADAGASRATYHQRLSRGRRDVRTVLASVVSREELLA
jgi:DNA-directed RNA polymerase specialized sigma24 family protein